VNWGGWVEFGPIVWLWLRAASSSKLAWRIGCWCIGTCCSGVVLCWILPWSVTEAGLRAGRLGLAAKMGGAGEAVPVVLFEVGSGPRLASGRGSPTGLGRR